MKNLLNLILALLGFGGFICGIILAVIAHAWVGVVAILALGYLAYPSIKRLVTTNDKE